MVSEVIDLINTTLKGLADYADNGSSLPIPTPRWTKLQINKVYGKKEVERVGHLPRLVWSFGSFKGTSTKHIGDNPHQGTSIEADVIAHIFCKSDNEIYYLMNDIVVSARKILHDPGLKYTGDVIDTGDEATNGYGLELKITMDLKILDTGLPYRTITSEELTTNFINIQPSS